MTTFLIPYLIDSNLPGTPQVQLLWPIQTYLALLVWRITCCQTVNSLTDKWFKQVSKNSYFSFSFSYSKS